MDGQRFDRLARTLATVRTRRQLLRALVGGATGGLLVPARGRTVRAACPPGQADCGGACVDLQSDYWNCGACGNSCGLSPVCAYGVCWASPGPGPGPILCGGPTTNLNCMAGLYCCHNPLRCVDLQTDATNCGACGNACPSGQTCQNGTCGGGFVCMAPLTDCNGVCRDLQTDPANCGGCNMACLGGLTCSAGVCVCPPSETDCGGYCVETNWDPANCGGCGIGCASQAGWGLCCMGVCVDPQTDAANCGGCGVACGATEYCDQGVCKPAMAGGPCTTPAGTQGIECNGVCVDAQTDHNHCGDCFHACGAGQTCANGACTGGAGCPQPLAACNGVCVEVLSDPSNCGACGKKCAAGQKCVNGVCGGGTVAPPAVDKGALWTGKTQLRGAHLLQRRVKAGLLGPAVEQTDLDRLATLGANYVEINYPAPATQNPPYKPSRTVRDNLDRLLQMAERAGLFAVIAFRTGPGRPERGLVEALPCRAGGCFVDPPAAGAASVQTSAAPLWADPAAQDAWVALWRAAAERYRDAPVVVGYNLLTFPDAPEPAAWWALAGRIAAEIREVDPTTPILVTVPPAWVGRFDSAAVAPLAVDGVVYRVDQLAPARYLLQPPEAADPLTYPGSFDPNRDGHGGEFGRDWVEELTLPLTTWARGHEVAVAIGAFGVPRWQPGTAKFLDDQMSAFETAGLNHGLWLWYPAATRAEGWADDAYNLEHGPDLSVHRPVDSSLIEVVAGHWRQNVARPERVAAGAA